MSWVDALGIYAAIQLSVALGAAVVRGVAALRVPPASALTAARVLLVAAVALPLLAAALPGTPALRPPVQVWSGPSAGAGAVVTLAAGDALATNAAPPVQADGRAMGALAVLLGAGWLLGLLRAARGVGALRRVVRGSVCWRRIGRVQLRVSRHAGTPFAVRWPGAAVVVLDVDTFADPADRRLAVLHELQHHRQGDTWFAHVALALGLLCWPSPFVRSWRRSLQTLEELACDAAVVRAPRVSPRAYGACLVRAAGRPRGAVPRVASVLAAGLTPAASRSLLKRRIDMLSCTRTRRWTLLPITAVAAALLASVAWGGDGLVEDLRLDEQRVAEAAALASSDRCEVPVEPAVLGALRRYTGSERGRRFVRRGLVAMEEHRAMVDDALRRHDLPPALAAIPLVESGYRNLPDASAESSAPPGPMGAGLWMFIRPTAREYGMRVDDVHDDRLDPVIETDAAMRLLGDLHAEFGDWPLALAGYNQGARHVRAAIAAEGTDDAWALIDAGALNDYAARVMAAAIVLEDPGLVDAD